jgi:hypothetical protein
MRAFIGECVVTRTSVDTLSAPHGGRKPGVEGL